MSGLIRQRARIARVRRLQHNAAASSAAAAAGQVRNLEMSRERLARMRVELAAGTGPTDGSRLAAAGELALRLEAAREGLGPTIDAARAAAARREQARVAARRDQESAEKLHDAAFEAAEELADRNLQRIARRRLRRQQGDVPS